MTFSNDVVVVWALALVGPGVLFVMALLLRQVPPPSSQPARAADHIVRWYASHPQFSLWVLLLFLPISAFILGSVALLRTWADNPQLQSFTWRALAAIPAHWAAVSIGGLTLVSAAMLVMITSHLMASQHPDRRFVSH